MEIKTDYRYVALVGLLLIFGIFGSLVGWAIFSRVDTVVIAPGRVILDNYKKPIESKEWGSVKEVMVKDGDIVKAGQPLIEMEKLEDTTMRNISEYDYYTLLARRDRLIAEKNLRDSVVYSPVLEKLENGLKEEITEYQNKLFVERRSKLNQQLNLIQERINQSKQRIEDLGRVRDIKDQQLKENMENLREERELLIRGLSTKDRVLSFQERVSNLIAEIREIDGQINQEKLRIEEYTKQKELSVKEYTTAAANELQEVLRNLNEANQKMGMYTQKTERSILKADIDGQVVGLKVFYPQQVVKPGEVILYIVPQGKEVVVDGVIFPKDRDKVKPGMKVDLNFVSFLNLAAKKVDGKVIFVSDDTVYEDSMKAEVYKVKIAISPEGLKTLKENNFEVVSGMPVVAYIKVEKIRPIEYLLQPVIMMIKSSFSSN